MKTKLFTLCVAIIATTSLFAYDCEVDGIYYNLYSTDLTAEVTSGNSNYSGSITIPSSIIYNSKTYSVTTIGNYAFRECSGLTSVTIGNSVTTIGRYAFDGCSGLISVTIDNSNITIEWDAFRGCTSITQIEAPAIFFDVQEYDWPSYSKSFESVVVNSGELTENALLYINRSYKTLKTIDVSAVTNTNFADEAFKGHYNLESLTLPQTLERISYMMVAGCKGFKSIDIPASVVEIDQGAFEDCRSIQTITFGGQQPVSASSVNLAPSTSTSQLKKIGNWAFYNAHELQHLEIPEGVEEIGEDAFYGCTYMEDLIISASVATLGEKCFALCSSLKKIIVKSLTPPAIHSKTFDNVSRKIPVYVPLEAVNAYKADVNWGQMNIIGVKMPTGWIQINGNDKMQSTISHKVLHDGQITILQDNNVYSTTGQYIR